MCAAVRCSPHTTSLLYPPAEADGIEEVAVAGGGQITAARLGQTGLCELRATGLHRFGRHFSRRGEVI